MTKTVTVEYNLIKGGKRVENGESSFAADFEKGICWFPVTAKGERFENDFIHSAKRLQTIPPSFEQAEILDGTHTSGISDYPDI